MKACHTKIVINAPIEKVWAILTDFDRYEEWNPLIGKIWGTIQENRIAFAHIVPLKSVFPIRIKSFKSQQSIIWQGKAFSANLMMGEHYYKLKDLGNNQTALEHGETFTGWASQFIPPLVLSNIEDSYKYHNQKLKIIAEKGNIL